MSSQILRKETRDAQWHSEGEWEVLVYWITTSVLDGGEW
jgi:hypothetical protein